MGKITDIFGELVFNKKIMKQKLSQSTYQKLIDTIQNNEPLDESIAEEIARAMKEWALDKGATHFSHWFQPQRGGTAEKHDAFLDYDLDGEILEKFTAQQLIQSEPDASSFPSGGIRCTFEARGYTAWDPSAPVFLLDGKEGKSLIIPSVYLSWTGDVLDLKTPMLRSLKALNNKAIKLQKLLGNRLAKKITVNAGPEQEYFLISKKLYEKRLDLQTCGRTIFGASPIKGQQMEDHYLGSIRPKVMDFMCALDTELYRYGIKAKTKHNEVAPNQFELAPLYDEVNLSIDHNLQTMTIIKKTAQKFGLVALLHEKPFAKLNGSGKHLNWSIGDNTGTNYLEPSKSPLKNINFLMTIAAILIGLHKYNGLLRAAVADAGNELRLGGNEAPPSIMSLYLGQYLSNLLDHIEGLKAITPEELNYINLDLQHLPKVSKDTSDRNRTSPLAFTGNKLEFRAVGSSHNCSEATTVLNLITAYGYDYIATKLEGMHGQDIKENAVKLLKQILKETKNVRFEGNNYSLAWQKEAQKRGLFITDNTPDALSYYLKPEVITLFTDFKILNKKELCSKVDIQMETYHKTKEIELKTALDLTKTLILPALLKQIILLGNAIQACQHAKTKGTIFTKELSTLENIYQNIQEHNISLTNFLKSAKTKKTFHQKALLFAQKGTTILEKLKKSVDTAERLIAAEYWPLPKYQELLKELD
jgi:glutamine synthetase